MSYVADVFRYPKTAVHDWPLPVHTQFTVGVSDWHTDWFQFAAVHVYGAAMAGCAARIGMVSAPSVTAVTAAARRARARTVLRCVVPSLLPRR